MNYKTNKAGEEEALLPSAWIEHSHVIPNNPQRPNRPSDILTTPRQLPSKETLSSNKSDKTDYPEGNSTQRSENIEKFNVDRPDLFILHQQDASKNAEIINKNDERFALTYTDWVSFDESNNHTNGTRSRTHITLSNQDFTRGDKDDIPGRNANKDDWVLFDIPKTKSGETVNSDSFTQRPCELQQDTNQSLNVGGQFMKVNDISLKHDILTNPFDNSELDRINSFQQTSEKTLNGGSPDSKPITQESSPTTPGTTGPPTSIIIKKQHSVSSHSEPPSSPPPTLEYPKKNTNKTWAVWLRYPDTKRKLRPREWRPVVLKLNGSILQVFEENDTSEPFREVSLQCFYELTSPNLQQYLGGKVHTVKIMYVKYKETSKRVAKKSGVQYIAKSIPIMKIASASHLVIREFTEVVKDGIRSLPIFRDRGISHNSEAVYIDVHDTCSALLDSTGNVLMVGILVRVYLRAFISGDAECELVLNDIHVKMQEEARLREEHMPQRVHKWITVENCDFHSTVSPDSYNQNHCVVFHPLDSCTFEVMQFQVQQLKPLPLLVKCDLIVDSHGRVELRSEVKLCSDPKLAKYRRKNICLYFSIPDTWVQLFMVHKLLRGDRSIRSTTAQKAIKMRNKLSRPPCTIEVSTGSAMYEPEYKSVVWRINHLPLLNTTAPADSAHDFKCQIQTPDSIGFPDNYKPHCVMEYEVPYTVASDTNIVNFKVSDQKIGTQEVSYNAYFSYNIEMEITCVNGGLQDDRWIHE